MASGKRFDEDHLQSLVQAIRDGDARQRGDAIAELFDVIDGWLLAQMDAKGVQRQDLKDLQQSVVVKLLQGVHGYKDGSVVSWIMRIVNSVVVDDARKFKVNAPEALAEGEEPAPQEAGSPVFWDAWQGKGLSFGRDVDQWSEGQRRLALEQCMDERLRLFEADEPQRGAAIRNTSLGQWTMRKLGEYLGKTENHARVYAQESRKKSARYFKDCLQFLDELSDRQRGRQPGEGRA